MTRPPRIRFFGTAAGGTLRGGPPPRRDFFISRVHPSTQESVFENFLKDKGLLNFELQLVSRFVSTFKSYKLTVSMDDRDKVLQPNMWPKGILVQKWRVRNGFSNYGNHDQNRHG